MTLSKETSMKDLRISCRSQFCCVCVYTKLEILILTFIDVLKLENNFHIFYQRMKVSLEARRLAKYKEKKKEISVAT